MQIPLREFELHVKPEPLERGLSLFENGRVESVRNAGKGLIEAVVQDADGTWHPSLQLIAEVITKANCGCGQSEGNLCKHAIALVFALESDQFKEGIATKSGKVPTEKKAPRRGRPNLDDEPAKVKATKAKAAKPLKPPKTAADILARVPHEALVEFLLQEIKIDKHIDIRLKAHFADLLPASTPKEVEKRILDVYKAAASKKGRINKGAFAVLLKRLSEWTKEADHYVELQDYHLAFAAANTLAKIISDLYAQDMETAKTIGEIEKSTQKVLSRLGGAQMKEPARSEVFELAYIEEMATHSSNDFLQLLSLICKDGQEFALIENRIIKKGEDVPALTQLHWEMIRRVKGDAAAEAFAKKHQHQTFFQLERIREASAAGNFEEAAQVAMSAFEKYERSPTRMGFWANQLDELYEKAGDIEGRIQINLRVYALGYRTERISLRKLIDIAGKERWQQIRADLISRLGNSKLNQKEIILGYFLLDQDFDGLRAYLLDWDINHMGTWIELMRVNQTDLIWNIIVEKLRIQLSLGSTMTLPKLMQTMRDLVRIRGKKNAEILIAELAREFPKKPAVLEMQKDFNTLTRNMWQP